MQEDQEHYPITKDNIVEVLEYNGVNIDIHIGTSISETSRIYIRHESISRDIFSCDLDRNWLSCLESFLNIKLKPIPIPKPKFDFISYVNNNSTDKDWEKIYKLAITMINGYTNLMKRDEHNAKIAVQMAKLAEELT
jgi:hypothetical protein